MDYFKYGKGLSLLMKDALSETPVTQADGASSGQSEPTLLSLKPEDLHPETRELIRCFAEAVMHKLAAAEKKYGYTDNWQRKDWMEECQLELVQHVAKGDPRDVAAYCAFAWHHNWRTAPATQTVASDSPKSSSEPARLPEQSEAEKWWPRKCVGGGWQVAGSGLGWGFSYGQASAICAYHQASVAALQRENAELLKILQTAYLKHHVGQDNIGWNELSDRMCDVLCNVMGDTKFQRWLEEQTEEKP